ncbi:photoreceptor outer segment membrane glycoprotein 2-like [Ptychodera flava]|uniref:photoreceptor outer segment membrane glycoprotein 2-like n=1 Tax=Ptychodera flava TaxID=63121 RepID=UPI003969E7D5
MPFLAIEISEVNRGKLGTVLWIFNWISAGCGVFIAAMGIYFKISVESKMALIEHYNSNVLPLMLAIVGCLSVVLFLAGGKICHSSGQTHSRDKFKGFLQPYICVTLVLAILILAGGSMCFDHRRHLHHSFHRGIRSAMERYKDNTTFKTEIDELQMDFRCCGNNDYRDWFDIQWISNAYLNLQNQDVKEKMKNGHYLNDDVPFSCCDPRAKRPCIHHHITDNNQHYNYDFNVAMTIYQRGCKAALTDYFSVRLENMGGIIMLIFVAQLIVLIGVRYLQTSIYNASVSGDPTMSTPGWLMGDCPLNCGRIPKSVRDKGLKDTESKKTDVESGQDKVSGQGKVSSEPAAQTAEEPIYEEPPAEP